MRKPEPLQRGERGVIDVVEFADSVYFPGAVLLPSFIHIAKKPNEKLINTRSGLIPAETATDGYGWRGFVTKVDFAIVRDVFVAFPGSDGRILRPKHSAPGLSRPKILRINNQIEPVLEVRERDAKNEPRRIPNYVIRRGASVAPLPPFPATLQNLTLRFRELHQVEAIRLKRQEDCGAFEIFGERNDCGSEFAPRPKREE